ncbi:hypothetical protein [Actinomadura sp. BRA 177]|uniref:hypothetical protein n=1 Tax=Actinomadura sp. BRA 177 TaxID=2745202 RepID=UPI0015953D00|nr:hypothetical protein [Actinomadura sp. BRA 177]NVI87061.1 hypothetical protein [Actinomadura sp. BRA 177]
MTMRRMMVMAGGAVVPIALISILVGNQWVVDAIDDTGIHWDEGIAPPIAWLLFPKWRLTGDQIAGKFILALDVSTVLFFVLLILLAVAGARAVDPNRGALGALVTGWWATIVAGGIAGFVLGVLTNWALDLPGGSGPNVLLSVTPGVAFGFAYGWLAGIGMLLGYVITRRGAAQRQPGQFAPQQPAMPMQQQAYGQPMQPQYAQQQYPQQQQQPYVPPQAQPQQPAWGGAPQQQYGAPPVPQQQPPVPQPAAPPAPEQPAQEAPPEQEKAPDDDDLGLADRTIIDRQRDGEDT